MQICYKVTGVRFYVSVKDPDVEKSTVSSTNGLKPLQGDNQNNSEKTLSVKKRCVQTNLLML